MPRRVRIGVIGAGACDQRLSRVAEEVGAQIASSGAILISGGLGGVMQAAARGAKAHGGLTIGILPTTDASDANPSIDVPIVTGLQEARNIIVVRSCQALIAIGGEYGTLSEIAFALKFGIPVIGLETWDLPARVKGPGILKAHSAEEAVALAVRKAVTRDS